MLTSGAILYISLFCDQQSHTDIFMFFSCTMHYTSQRFFFYIVRSMFPLLFNWSQSKTSVVNQKSHHFFVPQKYYFFSLFSTFWKSFSQSCFEVNQRYETRSWKYQYVNINAEIDNVDWTLFNVVNFNVDKHNVVSTIIWHCPTSRRHISLMTTLRPRWKVSWVLTNVAKRLHNFIKLIKLKTIYLSEYLLIAAFLSFWKGIDRTISILKK